MYTRTSLLPTTTSILLAILTITSQSHALNQPPTCKDASTARNRILCPPKLPEGQNQGDYIPYPSFSDKQDIHCQYDELRAPLVKDIDAFRSDISTLPKDGPQPPEARADRSAECYVVSTINSARVSRCREPGQPPPNTDADAAPLDYSKLMSLLQGLLDGTLCGPKPPIMFDLRRGIFMKTEDNGTHILVDTPAAPKGSGKEEGGLWGQVFMDMGEGAAALVT